MSANAWTQRPKTSLSKRELALVQKTISARQVKEGFNRPTTAVHRSSNSLLPPAITTSPVKASASTTQLFGSTADNSSNNATVNAVSSSLPSGQSLPRVSVAPRPSTAAVMTGPQAPKGSTSSRRGSDWAGTGAGSPSVSARGQETFQVSVNSKYADLMNNEQRKQQEENLSSTLAQRKLMPKTEKRKVQATFKNKMTQSTPGLLSDSENMYMSKSTRYRPDGIPLSEAYHFRKTDTWAQVNIAKALADDTREKQERQARKQADASYVRELQRQLDAARRAQKQTYMSKKEECFGDGYFVAEFYSREKAKKAHMLELQDKYRNDMKHDLEYLEELRDQERQLDLRASAAVLARIEIENEKELQRLRDKKERERVELERMVKENAELLKMKMKIKEDLDAEDRRLNLQAIEQQRKEEQRRKAEFDKLMEKTAGGDGPCHRLYKSIYNTKKKQEEDLYSTLLSADNIIEKQVAASEESSTLRVKNAQKGIKQEWDKQMTIKKKQKASELQASLALRDQILARQKQEADREAEAARRKKEQQLKYQRDLTAQLDMVHRRAFEEYAKTMSEEEFGMNKDLLSSVGFTREQLL